MQVRILFDIVCNP